MIKIHSSQGEIAVELIRTNRKTMALQVFGDGKIVVRAPKNVSDPEVIRFLGIHEQWILSKRQELTLRAQNKQKERAQYDIPDYENMGSAEKEMIRARFLERVSVFAPRMGVTYNRVTVRNQKGRWGSCSSKGNLNFNYRLYYLPQELMDYVVVHELAHRVYMNHSREFWSLVGAYMPNYRECQKLLGDIGIE